MSGGDFEGLVYQYDPTPITSVDFAHEEALWEKLCREGGPVYNAKGEVVGHLEPGKRPDDDGWLEFRIPLPEND